MICSLCPTSSTKLINFSLWFRISYSDYVWNIFVIKSVSYIFLRKDMYYLTSGWILKGEIPAHEVRYGKILIFEHHIICKFYYFESFSNIKFFLIKEEFCLRLPCLRKENHKVVCNAGNGVITHFPKNLKITTPRKPGKIKPFQSLLKNLKN